jgi:hypothetical protein
MATVKVTEVPPVEAEKVFTLILTEREAEYVATALGSVSNRTDIVVFSQLDRAGVRWGSTYSPERASRYFSMTKDEKGYTVIRDA